MNDIWQSCLRQNILEFKTGGNSQRIPDSDLHPKKPLVRVRVRSVTGGIGYVTAFQRLFLGYDFKRYPENEFHPIIYGFKAPDPAQMIGLGSWGWG